MVIFGWLLIEVVFNFIMAFFLRIGYKSGGSLANIIFQITSGEILAHWEGKNTWIPDEYFCAFPYMVEVFP